MTTVGHDETDAVPEVASLTPLLHEEMVAGEELEERYGDLLRLVDAVLGVVPNLPVPVFGWASRVTVAKGNRRSDASCCFSRHSALAAETRLGAA
ncbi:MAG: hypothetical protein M3445_00515, partial [Actinomycetota bacterium]|nr:hypothetical protein [Actinomycetota bacterium]